MRTLLFHAHLPASFWAEALAAATFLLNRRPCKAIGFLVPYTRLHGHPPSYDALRVFGCLCYPNVASTAQHKLSPRFVRVCSSAILLIIVGTAVMIRLQENF
jgi:histone deacetylase 1/2